jgi:cobalt/nickel transport system ATP-binding protein
VTVLDVRDLAFSYPDGTLALDGVDLTVERGERLAVLGPNGAGKTTLVLALNGINAASRGASPSPGWPVDKANLPEIRRRVGIVFQDPDDQLFMPTVRDDVAFGPSNLGLRGDELAARTAEALAPSAWRTPAERAPHHLSFGERRRVALATVLAMRPTSSSSTSRRRTSIRWPVASWPRSCSASTSRRSWSPTTCPYALQLCGGR